MGGPGRPVLAGLLLLAASLALVAPASPGAPPVAFELWRTQPVMTERADAFRELLGPRPAAAAPRLRELARAGDHAAALNLGLLSLDEGRKREARAPLEQAAWQGNRLAQFYLAGLLLDSPEDRADRIEAYVWSGLAARAGNSDAERLNGRLRRQLDDAERREGNERIWHWQPRQPR